MSIHFLEVCQEAVEENNKEVFDFLIRYELKYPDEETEGYLPSFMVAALDNATRELFLMAYKSLNSQQLKSLVREIEASKYNQGRLLTILRWISEDGNSIGQLISLSRKPGFVRIAQQFRN